MKVLNYKIVLAFLTFFFLGFNESKAEQLSYTESTIVRSTPIAYYYFNNTCEFYDYRVTHQRTCGRRYNYSYYHYIVPFPQYRHHYRHHRPYYNSRPLWRYGHHYSRHYNLRHNRFGNRHFKRHHRRH